MRHFHSLLSGLGAAMLAIGWTIAAAADAPVAVASIKPIHSLLAGVMEGAGRPVLLVPGGASPHTWSLRPSDAEVLDDADLVVWIGEEMESFLARPLQALASDAHVLELSRVEGITLLEIREGGAWGEHDHDHGHGHEAEHDGEAGEHGEHGEHEDHGDEEEEEHGHDGDEHGHEDEHGHGDEEEEEEEHGHGDEHGHEEEHGHEAEHGHGDEEEEDHGHGHVDEEEGAHGHEDESGHGDEHGAGHEEEHSGAEEEDDHAHHDGEHEESAGAEGEEHGEEHAHHGAEHEAPPGTFNMHLWLDPANAAAMVDAMADALSRLDPEGSGLYRENAARLRTRLGRLDEELAETLAPVSDRGFIVFHDAWQYFDTRYRLRALGSVTVSPDQPPGAARLTEIREKLTGAEAECVFAEPQFEPRLVRTLVAGTGAATGTLDPLGMAIEEGPDLYFALMRDVADSFRACFEH